jgi:hypothetical protein
MRSAPQDQLELAVCWRGRALHAQGGGAGDDQGERAAQIVRDDGEQLLARPRGALGRRHRVLECGHIHRDAVELGAAIEVLVHADAGVKPEDEPAGCNHPVVAHLVGSIGDRELTGP